ncbi:MAG: hypothetical protein M3R54_07990 [Chloroflexota bacterium]|nr:hypothetical protein [Chloroflexota bacterium]
MPIYDYRCDECGHVFSAVQSYSEGPIQLCPNCGKRPRRLISMPAIVFKGGGWYKTDSRGAAPKESQDSGSGGPTGADAKSDSKVGKSPDGKSEKGKADSKADSKSESAPASKTEAKASSDAPKSESKS